MKEDISISREPNGLCVLSDRMTGVRSATLGFFCRLGSRHEPSEFNGMTHFIEHTVFKGTSRRSALEIAIEQDRLGGTLDAFTTHEETGFVIKVIDDQVERAFDLLADMWINPAFDEKELAIERNVIIEEMKMVEDSPEEYLGEIFGEAFFPQHPLGLNIVGTPETVETFDHARTKAYHQRAFHASNLVIAAAGNVYHSQIEDLAARYFDGDGRGQEAGPRTNAPKTAAPIVVRQNKNLEQAHLVIATPFVAATDERRYAAELLANILGGGNSSRLWQKVREERGLAYNVGASAIMFRDCGYFSIFAATSPDQTADVVDISIEELREVLKSGVTTDELELAKQQARASILLSLEDSAARAGSLANSEMTHGGQISVEETLERVDAVTIEETQALAEEYFQTDKVAFAALGNLKGLTIERERLALA